MIRAALLSLLPLPALAVTLDMPANAALTAEDVSAADSYAMPIGSWTVEGLPTQTEAGAFVQQAWRIEATGLTTFQIIDPLEAQLIEAGFDVVFTCTDDVCGGFDFRFSTRVLPAPDMQVNFGDYRYLAARRTTDEDTELVSLLASRSSSAGFVQVTRVGGQAEVLATAAAPAVRAQGPVVTGDLAQELEQSGRFILSDLTFKTGSAQLGDASFDSLRTLAEYLIANPDRQVALVGHTDAVGSLDSNIALSKRRSGSVLERLVTTYNVPRRQLDAQGIGYLAPVATNVTEAGRDANRRVEVIITSTQ
ncbi:OmpA family protein [Pseudooctadecabacter sp.]|uniref:OmpA family protein n=1 Tax=Pseudooctadecabacter sp. TaxID=1966338 RepID=UPI0035C8727F